MHLFCESVQLQPFGSFISGLGTKDSDLDLVITGAWTGERFAGWGGQNFNRGNYTWVMHGFVHHWYVSGSGHQGPDSDSGLVITDSSRRVLAGWGGLGTMDSVLDLVMTSVSRGGVMAR